MSELGHQSDRTMSPIRLVDTNPTQDDFLEIMRLQAKLEEEDFQSNCLRMNPVSKLTYGNTSALGKASEETTDEALSLSETFLKTVTDVDGTFQASKVDCLELAAGIMDIVDRGQDVNPAEVKRLTDLRDVLVGEFSMLQDLWEDLSRSALDFDESVAFVHISELVEVAEEAMDNALFHSRDLLQSIDSGGPHSGAEIDGADDNRAGDRTGGDEGTDSIPGLCGVPAIHKLTPQVWTLRQLYHPALYQGSRTKCHPSIYKGWANEDMHTRVEYSPPNGG